MTLLCGPEISGPHNGGGGAFNREWTSRHQARQPTWSEDPRSARTSSWTVCPRLSSESKVGEVYVCSLRRKKQSEL